MAYNDCMRIPDSGSMLKAHVLDWRGNEASVTFFPSLAAVGVKEPQGCSLNQNSL